MNNILKKILCVLIALIVLNMFLCLPVSASQTPEDPELLNETVSETIPSETPSDQFDTQTVTEEQPEEETPYELDLKGSISVQNTPSSTSAKITVAVSGADINQLKAVCLGDDRQLEYVADQNEYVFEVKANGTYKASLLLVDDSLLDLEESVTVNCIDTVAPSIKSVTLPIDPLSKGVAVVKATASDGHPAECNSAHAGVQRLYITEFGSATTVSDTNALDPNGNYLLEVRKNGKYTIYAVDKAGNVSQGYTVSINVFDTSTPVIEIVSIEYDEKDTAVINVTFTVTDDNDITSVEVTDEKGKKIDKVSKTSKGYKFSVTKNGIYVIVATDSAGNSSEEFDVEVDLVDITPPVIAFGATEYKQEENCSYIPFSITDETGLSLVYVNGEQVNNLEKDAIIYSGTGKIYNSGTLEVLAYDLAGNSTYDHVTINAADAPMPVIISLDVTDVTDTTALATVTTESNVGLSYEWYILDPNGKWSKLAGEQSSIELYNLKRHTDYSVQVVVYNESGNSVSATASFTTESMGVIYEGDDSWMLYVAIAVVAVFLVIVLLFFFILKGSKPTSSNRRR